MSAVIVDPFFLPILCTAGNFLAVFRTLAQNGGKKMFELVLWQQAVRMDGGSMCSHELAVTESNCIATCITYISGFAQSCAHVSPTLQGPIARLWVGAAKQKMMGNVSGL